MKYLPLDDFLKTNLAKFAVIWVKRRRKANFLGPINSQIKLTMEKERKKERARRKKGEEEKKAMVALLVIVMATLGIVLDELLDAKGPFGNASLITPEFSVRNEVL